ncbi:hypothetical protein HNQ56_004779 [Anaerotaenia torta]
MSTIRKRRTNDTRSTTETLLYAVGTEELGSAFEIVILQHSPFARNVRSKEG